MAGAFDIRTNALSEDFFTAATLRCSSIFQGRRKPEKRPASCALPVAAGQAIGFSFAGQTIRCGGGWVHAGGRPMRRAAGRGLLVAARPPPQR